MSELVVIALSVRMLSFDHHSKNLVKGKLIIYSKWSTCLLIFYFSFSYFSVAFFPLQMGDHVFVGERAVVNAAVVGSYVYIGKNAIIVR